MVFVLISCCVGNLKISAFAEKIGEVEIDADSLSTNFVTSESKLEGNVILRHQGMILRCGLAEIFPASETNQEPRYILREQLALAQDTQLYSLSAQAGEAIYLPTQDELTLQKNVNFQYKQAEQLFTIESENLQVNLNNGAVENLVSTGAPSKFTQTFGSKTVVIEAASIDWFAATQVAILKEASLDDGATTFSASEIEYNTATGAISAQGRGENRPKYRFNSDVTDKQEDKKNDT